MTGVGLARSCRKRSALEVPDVPRDRVRSGIADGAGLVSGRRSGGFRDGHGWISSRIAGRNRRLRCLRSSTQPRLPKSTLHNWMWAPEDIDQCWGIACDSYAQYYHPNSTDDGFFGPSETDPYSHQHGCDWVQLKDVETRRTGVPGRVAPPGS